MVITPWHCIMITPCYSHVTGETVSGGQIAVKVKYGIITVFHQTLNLCDVAKDANFPCPISPGTHAVTYKLPENIPNISVGLILKGRIIVWYTYHYCSDVDIHTFCTGSYHWKC